ncbi:MAG: hypothetical protein KKA56_00365 [Gammaproteobacteria bacterium]|nr:hypothetical protein [Gammaproteobacteria bacterium]
MAMQAVHHLFRQVLTLLLVIITLGVICFWLLFDAQPLVTPQGRMNAEAVRHSKQLLSNLNSAMQNPTEQQWVFSANTDELNSAFALASRTLPGFRGQAQVTPEGLTSYMTLPVTLLGKSYYLNASVQVHPSTGPLDIQQVTLGMLTLPGDTALSLLGWFADRLWGPGKGASLLAMVRSVQFQQDEVKVEVTRPGGWDFQRLKQSGLSVYRELFSSPAQTANLEFYYKIAAEYAVANPNSSLHGYLQLLFRQAQLRTAVYQDEPGRAQLENQAVLLAMAQLLGGRNLQLLVNEVKKAPGGKAPRVTLARRPDLQQHFIYSATIQVLTNKNVSDTVGEAKELLDSIKGGSGFSFVDLLADRAGVRFAQIAIGSASSAAALQQFFSQEQTEADLFPSKSRLPEGLSQQTFEQDYQSVDSVNYQKILQDIDQRLDALPLYQIRIVE